MTALQTAQLSGLNRNTANRFYRALQERTLWACEVGHPMLSITEVDESFFGARRVKGKRGRGAYGKAVVFGVFERDGKIYTDIEGFWVLGSGKGLAKVRPAKFKGLPKHTFHLHLRENQLS